MDWNTFYLQNPVWRQLGYGSGAELQAAFNKYGDTRAVMQNAPARWGSNQGTGTWAMGPGGIEGGNNTSESRWGSAAVQFMMDRGMSRDDAQKWAAEFFRDPEQRNVNWGTVESDRQGAQEAFNAAIGSFLNKANRAPNSPISAAIEANAKSREGAANDTSRGVAPPPGQGQNDAISARLWETIQGLQSNPENDPYARQLGSMGANYAQRDAAARGIEGGLSGLNVQQGANQAIAPYLFQRQQLAMQGLGALNSRDLGQMQNAIALLNAQNQATSFQNEAARQNYAAQQNQGAGVGSAIGGALGALGGGLLTAVTGGAAAPAIPGLIAGGSALGGGIGGMSSGGRPPTMGGYYSQPSYRGFSPSGGSGY